VLVTLPIEWLAEPSLDVRYDHIVEHAPGSGD
jgi:hypothetical protein